MKVYKVIGIGSVGLLMGFMPLQAQQTPSEVPAPSVVTLPTAVVSANPGGPNGAIIVPSEQGIDCVPMEYGQRKMWTCDGRHQLTFSEPQAWCREVGRRTICERE